VAACKLLAGCRLELVGGEPSRAQPQDGTLLRANGKQCAAVINPKKSAILCPVHASNLPAQLEKSTPLYSQNGLYVVDAVNRFNFYETFILRPSQKLRLVVCPDTAYHYAYTRKN